MIYGLTKEEMMNKPCEVCGDDTDACTFESACACWYGRPCLELHAGASLWELQIADKAKA